MDFLLCVVCEKEEGRVRSESAGRRMQNRGLYRVKLGGLALSAIWTLPYTCATSTHHFDTFPIVINPISHF